MVYECRKDIADRYKWRLEDIIPNEDKWEEMYSVVKHETPMLADFKGMLRDRQQLLACLDKRGDLSHTLSRLYVYAKMRLDEDARVSRYKAMTERAEMLSVELSSAAAFITPEITEMPSEELIGIAADERFVNYSYYFKTLAKLKEHILSEKEERILAEAGGFADMFQDAFNMFDNADIKFEPVIGEDGKSVEMSHGMYSVLLMSEDRRVRKEAFESMFGAFKDMINTVAVLYAGNVKKDVFYAKMRKYASAMEMSVAGEDVDGAVYDNLVEAVNVNLGLLHGYMAYRKKEMGLDELHMYDIHVSIVEGNAVKVNYEEAYDIVRAALLPLGSEYQGLLDMAYNNGWIDVYESKGKRSGAYSWGVYGSHPYVLLNYQQTTHDVFTIAHELGHAMHTYYSDMAQPREKAGYEIFVAEVASTVNEVLMLKHLLKTRPEMKKYLLTYYLDMFRTTLFRQTQFAEFEKRAHELCESGESLTPELLNKEYYGLNRKYYGEETVSDELIKYEWARIPHFYNSFYVYKYATGIISAVAIAESILTEGAPAVKRYKEFLSAGGSMSPVDILKLAGVDLTTKEPYERAMKAFKDTLEELQTL